MTSVHSFLFLFFSFEHLVELFFFFFSPEKVLENGSSLYLKFGEVQKDEFSVWDQELRV